MPAKKPSDRMSAESLIEFANRALASKGERLIRREAVLNGGQATLLHADVRQQIMRDIQDPFVGDHLGTAVVTNHRSIYGEGDWAFYFLHQSVRGRAAAFYVWGRDEGGKAIAREPWWRVGIDLDLSWHYVFSCERSFAESWAATITANMLRQRS